MNKIDKSRERDLFHRLVDGRLSEEEFHAFSQRLLSDEGFRERYVRAIDVEAGLYEAFHFPGTYTSPVVTKKSPILFVAITATCTSILLAVAGLYVWTSGMLKSAHPLVADTSAAKKHVAVVTQVNGVEDNSLDQLKPGMRIKPGIIRLKAGQLQIEFLNAVQINIEGPAELNIESVEIATLISGKAAARVPNGARGFVLNTPGAAIVDMGTEFAVSVGSNGESEVHVVEGLVDVSLLGNDGNTLTSRNVAETKTLRVNRKPAGLERIAAPNVPLPGLQSQLSGPLRVPDSYIRSIHESEPLLYWRFEKLMDGRVPNEMGPRWSGIIHSEADDSSAIVVHDGMARFTRTAKPHRLEPDEVIPDLNRESYTFEFWVSPDNFHWATMVAVVPNVSIERNVHMSLIELPYRCSLVYPPGSFRFLKRRPPASIGGTNLFTESDCTPGLWHHLAAVKSPTGLKLFLNGMLIRQHAETVDCDEEPYRFYVGQLFEGLTDRQLSGAIDELALYLRVLSDEEIAEHYRAMMATRAAN